MLLIKRQMGIYFSCFMHAAFHFCEIFKKHNSITVFNHHYISTRWSRWESSWIRILYKNIRYNFSMIITRWKIKPMFLYYFYQNITSILTGLWSLTIRYDTTIRNQPRYPLTETYIKYTLVIRRLSTYIRIGVFILY